MVNSPRMTLAIFMGVLFLSRASLSTSCVSLPVMCCPGIIAVKLSYTVGPVVTTVRLALVPGGLERVDGVRSASADVVEVKTLSSPPCRVKVGPRAPLLWGGLVNIPPVLLPNFLWVTCC